MALREVANSILAVEANNTEARAALADADAGRLEFPRGSHGKHNFSAAQEALPAIDLPEAAEESWIR